MDFTGKVCIVTGAGGGIGSAIANEFYKLGANIAIVDIKGLDATVEKYGFDPDRCLCLEQSITEEESAKDIMAATKEKFGKIDNLVNTAGISGRYQLLEDFDVDNFKKIYEVNVLGTFLMMKSVIPYFKENGGGNIVNFASISGMTGYKYETAYGGSKWAVIGMTKVAAKELGRDNIRVNAVSPGIAQTEMLWYTLDSYRKDFGAVNPEATLSSGPIPYAARPEQVAKVVLFACSDDADYVTGANLVVDGGKLM